MITGHERHRNVRDVWNHATEQIGKRLMDKLEYDTKRCWQRLHQPSLRHGRFQGPW